MRWVFDDRDTARQAWATWRPNPEHIRLTADPVLPGARSVERRYPEIYRRQR